MQYTYAYRTTARTQRADCISVYQQVKERICFSINGISIIVLVWQHRHESRFIFLLLSSGDDTLF